MYPRTKFRVVGKTVGIKNNETLDETEIVNVVTDRVSSKSNL